MNTCFTFKTFSFLALTTLSLVVPVVIVAISAGAGYMFYINNFL